MKLIRVSVFVLLAAGFVASVVPRGRAQQRPGPNKELIAARNATEKELEAIAIIERKLMVPMRDGKRMATDIYRPKDTSKKYPIIFVRTPYNFNFWDVRNGAPRDMTRGAGGREARLRLRGDERARPLLLRGQLRHSRRAADRRRRTRSRGCPRSRGRTARSAPSAAPPPRNGNWAWRRRAIRRSRR